MVPPSAHSVSDCDSEDDDLKDFVLVKHQLNLIILYSARIKIGLRFIQVKEDRSSARKTDEKLTTDQDKTLGHSENDELTSKKVRRNLNFHFKN